MLQQPLNMLHSSIPVILLLQSFAIDQPRVARRYDFSKVGKQTMKPRQDVIATWKLLKLSLFWVSFEIGLPWVYHEFTEIPGKPNVCWQGCRSLGGITLGRSSNTAGLEFLIAPGSSQVLKQSNKSRQLLKFQAFPFAKPPKCVSFLCLIFIIISRVWSSRGSLAAWLTGFSHVCNSLWHAVHISSASKTQDTAGHLRLPGGVQVGFQSKCVRRCWRCWIWKVSFFLQWF